MKLISVSFFCLKMFLTDAWLFEELVGVCIADLPFRVSLFQQFTLSKCMDAMMVLGNSHLFMNRSNRLAVIASHIQER